MIYFASIDSPSFHSIDLHRVRCNYKWLGQCRPLHYIRGRARVNISGCKIIIKYLSNQNIAYTYITYFILFHKYFWCRYKESVSYLSINILYLTSSARIHPVLLNTCLFLGQLHTIQRFRSIIFIHIQSNFVCRYEKK